MSRNQFNFRKKNQLEKDDKSLKQSWDRRILKLCGKINLLDDFYTTSSCSGRVLLLRDCEEKRDDLFLKVWHDEIVLKDLKDALAEIGCGDLIYFKQDPCILHVACRDLESAQKIHDLAKEAGWKRCGIIATDKRFVVELNATGKLEFPIWRGGEVLVDDGFLEVVVKEANKKLRSSWNCINRFERAVERIK